LEEDGDPVFGSPNLLYQGTATSHSVSGKTNGAWNYRVQACATGQCGAWRSASVLVQLPPGAPGTPSFEDVVLMDGKTVSLDGSYTVQWSGPAGEYTKIIL